VIGDYVEINAGAQLISNDRGRGSLTVGNPCHYWRWRFGIG